MDRCPIAAILSMGESLKGWQAMNLNDVRGKLDVLAANQKQLDWLRSLPQGDFVADVRNLDSTLHRLQTSIQALLDMAAYVVASLKLGTPSHTADIIFAL